MKGKQMVRPAKTPSKKMDRTLPVRLTIEQRKLIEAAAASCSLEASSWVRMVMVEAARQRLAEVMKQNEQNPPRP
jgi:uncharacterized protein (DUF1778 family)